MTDSYEITTADTDAHELAAYETPVSTLPIPNVTWSIEKHKVAQMLALEGKSIAQISRETGVPVSAINKWNQHGEFRDYKRQIIMEAAKESKDMLLSLNLKILNARVAAAEETGDYARLSGKDTLDIMESVRKLTTNDDPKEDSQYSSILEKILGITNKPIEINK